MLRRKRARNTPCADQVGTVCQKAGPFMLEWFAYRGRQASGAWSAVRSIGSFLRLMALVMGVEELDHILRVQKIQLS